MPTDFTDSEVLDKSQMGTLTTEASHGTDTAYPKWGLNPSMMAALAFSNGPSRKVPEAIL